MEQKILTLKEVQEILGGASRDFALYCMEQSGQMLPRKVKGSKYFVRRDPFLAWLNGGAK